MASYYNEFEPFAAEWLRELIKEGHIADGVVDERSIVDVRPEDLKGFTQCHFFAGIGGWSRALRVAGWPDSRPVWTGSPPCQPFSAVGRQLGTEDERHLAPVWLELVKACKPVELFGEQVAAAIKKDNWLDDLQDSLEKEGYSTGEVVLPACSVGAPQLRQRLWFIGKTVGESKSEGLERYRRLNGGNDSERRQVEERQYHTTGLRNSWADTELRKCHDGFHRPVEPSTCTLAYGISNRVGKLRGYGNAIVPEVAAEVIRVSMEIFDEYNSAP